MKKFLLSTALLASSALAATVTVNPSAAAQKVTGFGGASVYYQSWLKNLPVEDQEAIFDTAFTGLNLSLLRVGNWYQDEDATKLQDDIDIVKAAKKRLGDHMKIQMSSWSAPGKLKPSGSLNGNDGHSKSDKTLKKANGDAYGAYAYTDFANWWKRSLDAYTAAGITPDYISLQNEPDMEAEYEETLFEPTETNEIAGYKEALNAVYDAVKGKTKLLGPEPLGIGYSNFEKYAKELDANKLDGYAYHLYHAGDGNDNSGNNYLDPENFRKPMKAIADIYGIGNKPIIMTEFCPMLDEPREKDMLGLAQIMQIGFTDGRLSGYIAWQLFWGHHSQMIGICPGAGWDLDGSGRYVCEEAGFKIFPEYHAMRHYSKFVNPGSSVIATATAETNLKTVAFLSASGDSITTVLINSGNAAIQLDNPAIAGYGVITAVQSKENGFKSKNITVASCTVLPARSITTLVYKKGATASTVATCKDETTDPTYTEPVIVPTADIVIVDYTATTDVSTWQAISDKLSPVTYGTTAIDGIAGYASVPLAGCDQSEESCGYQNQLLNISTEGAKALASCASLVITMRSQGSSDAYVNVGGAAGGSWVDYEYGKLAAGSKWSETKVSLKKEGENGSTALTFNSESAGIYIAKIVATGCTGDGSAIKTIRRLATNDNKMQVMIFDLNGNLVWKGIKSEALNDNGTLKPGIRQGAYILKTKSNAQRVFKK
ncbi:glycoside hydrolase family 30 beta sandwich domain-containing protein [Fibrobacter sp. UBA4297]|uniref:glycoside hydrolase family 30 beta sandwich domain-containing protein n=1 Tax=Fibrobacter sp. UBA4297 TaxID=1946536 RepID=UPI0025C11769|nr:glycoside hydrolase family 30 beta sandwich domain-containing protein [Fibrobacter sp. UBA4297]